MRCRRAITVASMMLLVLTAACTSSDNASSESDVVIAASLELTGSSQTLGNAYKQALTLEVERINNSGVLDNRKVSLVVSDNRTESDTALTQVKDFSADPDVVAIVMGACSECTTAAATVAEEVGIPLISLAPSVPTASGAEISQYVFKVGPNASDNATALTTELIRAGMNTVGLLAPTDAYGQESRAAFTAAAAKAGITITKTAEFGAGDTDYSTQAHTIVSSGSKPEAVVILAYPTQAGLIATALRSAGFKGAFYLDASAAGDLFISEATQTAIDGATMIFIPTMTIDDVIATTPAKAERKEWFEDYTAEYGVYQGQSSFAADAVDLIVDAVSRATSLDRATIRSNLETARTDGLSGPIRMKPNNHSGLMPQALTVLVAQNGRWRLLG